MEAIEASTDPIRLRSAGPIGPIGRRWLRVAVAMGLLSFGCGEAQDERAKASTKPVRNAPAADPVSCPDANPDRNIYWGDLHVHTALSSDAWMFDVRTTPDDAYRYAFGGSVLLPPLDAAGAPTRRHRNPRPLDFMAVTDHAEFLGELEICRDPQAPGAESALCEAMRTGTGRSPELLEQIFSPFPERDEATCGEDLERCATAADSIWQGLQQAAERWNQACEQTTFVAYEYSSFRMGSNLHRNVIFRNAIVPASPISFLDATRDYELWAGLAEQCLDAGTGCDVLAIPHNSNISNGRMFSINYPGAWTRSGKADLARLRMRIEPVIEMMQHKGDSECRNGLPGVQGGVDEYCDFEKFEDNAFRNIRGSDEAPPCYEGWGADWWFHRGPDCLSRQSYARTALIEGLRQEAEIGVNPFKFGLSASTDTHNGIGGAVEEANFAGHLGIGDDTPAKRASLDAAIAGNANNNPGGLIAVLAEQNTRDSIFEAIRRREVFGTSGPRIGLRFYGAGELPEDLCDLPDRLARADAAGVAMGSDLPPLDPQGAPQFLAIARSDPGTQGAPGAPLERLQIVKGWVGADGEMHQRVFDIAGTLGPHARVSADTCRPDPDAGHRELCRVWRDPEFDASRRAVYYIRAIENPSCRYSRWACLELPAEERPESCRDESLPATIQERAWSSPIWYTPDAEV